MAFPSFGIYITRQITYRIQGQSILQLLISAHVDEASLFLCVFVSSGSSPITTGCHLTLKGENKE